MFSKSGPTPDEAVRRVSKAALVAWALELAVPLARGQTVDGAQVGGSRTVWASREVASRWLRSTGLPVGAA